MDQKETSQQGPMHYQVLRLPAEAGMDVLRAVFPNGEADDLNQAIFSTSGTHGSYLTIEDVERSLRRAKQAMLTVMIIRPRLVAIQYGDIIVTRSDLPFLRKLRTSSQCILARLGSPNEQ